MRFIEITGKTLATIIDDGEIHQGGLESAGVGQDTIIRVNEQGDIEVRRTTRWDVIGGLLGNFDERIKKNTGLDWV